MDVEVSFRCYVSSLFYTFTFIVVLVFAIEIQQGITDRGNMELADAMVGLWGYVVFFVVYAILLAIWLWLRKIVKRGKRKRR